MKKLSSILFKTRGMLVAGLTALVCYPAFGLTFTNSANIGPANTNFDGLDITVSNCTLVVDGAHAFNSLHVTAAGVLTHSFATNGAVSNIYYVTNEAQVLYGMTPVTLLNPNVIAATVIVTGYGTTNVYTNGLDYLLSSPDGVVTQLQRTTNSTISDGGIVLVSYQGFGATQGTVPAGLNLTIAGNVQVDAGGFIFTDGLGFNVPGVGAGSGGGGGSYGGVGGVSATGGHAGTTYGVYNGQPNLGYGGGNGITGPGGAGGGLVQINSGGNVILNGVVTANGANGTNDQSGGGAGGGIFITANTLSGTGAISANGGPGEPANGGGGGGGRISLQYNATSFTGSMTAIGGIGYAVGSAGSIYTKLAGQNGLVLYDNGGRRSGTNTTISLQNSSTDLLIRSNATVTSSTPITVGNLTVASNGFLLASTGPQGPQLMTITTFGALTVKAGGAIVADGFGYAQNVGTGSGRGINSTPFSPCGGGGYGGYGASSPSNSLAVGGITYGSQASPSGFGSGGGGVTPYSVGGAGGGDIQINSESGIVQVDGVISANGLNGSGTGGGGGAGGTVWINGGTLVGAGSITANGGSGAIGVGGGGGGGRVEVNPTANLFAGVISAFGGDGGGRGGAGTVFILTSSPNGGQTSQLIIDNNGHFGTNTPVQSSSTTDLIVRGGGVACAVQSASFANLYVNSNGWIFPFVSSPSEPDGISLSFTGNATIQAGGGIISDSAGLPPGSGENGGGGHTGEIGSTNLCGGGGHGGPGGNSFGNYALGGSTYDSVSQPGLPGSGGGTFAPLSPGGFGGGVITLSVTGTLEVDGVISANGGNGSGLAGGGGSGGSIRLSAGTIAGAGSITANGGNGADGLGGGGGGGMIAFPIGTYSFAGTITAYGGSGANSGGAGTLYLPGGSQRFQLILDAGGNVGPATPISGSGSTTDLTVRNGAKGSVSGITTLGNVVISSNSSLLASNWTLTCATLTVQPGGSILSDALYGFGNAVGQGSTSSNYPCGGGGNGGPGGNSIGNLALGGVNLLYYEALQGSAGGSEIPYSIGGLGGGAITINCTGLMQVDGIISANGGNGTGLGGGGGAGGAIAITCGSIGGGGTIRVNGGAGVGSIGGGGGGGDVSITINNTVNQFTGLTTAYGGSGANWAGAGLVTVKLSGQTPQVTLDAGNNPVTPSAINTSTSQNLTLRNGAIGVIGSGSQSTIVNLLIASNSWLYVSNGSSSAATLSCSSVTIQPGGGISADSMGYAASQGNGSGRFIFISPYYPCGGGAHGGVGGNSISNLATGGLPYDNQSSPISSGSGGGTANPNSLGGAGGGAFYLTVTGLLQVDGVLSANGGNGSGIGGGGGAGGGIRITSATLAGAGTIRANGGSGVGSIGGGGSGGIIAINSTTDSFTGTISAWGGSGAVAGGAGTVYMQSSSPPLLNGEIIVDNNGQSGAFTPLQPLSSLTAILLRNGGFAYQQSTPETFASILIASNGWLTANTNVSQVNLSITGNATVEAGGGIIANGTGSPGGIGLGAGQASSGSIFLPGGGGGYGGNGGNGLSNSATGGAAYGSITEPTAPGSGSGFGSGGGSIVPNSPGGSGGGGVRLNVNGTLDVSGTISANGNNGGGLGGGGGSGGSIWLTAGTLTGVGSIAANGGNGAEGNGGGGGGGRISLGYNLSSFVGLTAAHGGVGFMNGGAGTIYTAAGKQSSALVLADNGGLIGTNTPMAASLGTPSGAFNLTVQNGAVVGPQANSSFPELNNLIVASGGALTGLPGSTLDIIVAGNADIQPGGALAVDGEGNSQQNGPGAGQGTFYGSGAGYGGAGGASFTTAGGPAYGSATQPVDFGSGGGTGNGRAPGFSSAGGGALRLNVGGILTVDGSLTSEGEAGLADSSGGGSGGSIWITAGMLAGGGNLAADGGEGQLYYGGGGAGGRIALYSRTNIFGGATSAAGAEGYAAGANGTIVISNNIAPLVVLSNTPTGVISNTVGAATIYFSGAPNPVTLSGSTISINTPNGLLSSSSLSVVMVNSSTYQVLFPKQTTPGIYTVAVSQGVADLYGRPLSQTYAQTFSISLPAIQGTITDALGNPLAGVALQNSGGFTPVTTDMNGNYTLGFLPGTAFTVTPTLANYTFTPSSLSYATTVSVTGQNYTGVSTLAPALATSASGSSLAINWQGVAGVNYNIYTSSNLVDWVACGNFLCGTNGPAQCVMPIATNGMQFFTVQPGN